MKKTSQRFVIFLTLILLLASFTSCGKEEKNEKETVIDPKTAEAPAEVQAVKDKVTTLAADYALKLNNDYADKFKALMDSKEGRSYAGYAELKATLDGFLKESGARYVYILVDSNPSDIYFDLTIDAGDDPDDWLTQYEVEGQFLDAMNGIPAPALSAWYDDPEANADPTWSAFAPIYDTKGDIIAILGIDYPAPEITKFPEWNRDTKEWNGIEY